MKYLICACDRMTRSRVAGDREAQSSFISHIKKVVSSEERLFR